MSSQKSAVMRVRTALGVLIAGLIVTLLWPIVTAVFVPSTHDFLKTVGSTVRVGMQSLCVAR